MSNIAPEYQSADIQDIKRMIPHRYPFLLIDAVKEIKLNEVLSELKTLRLMSHIFRGIVLKDL